MKLKIIVAHECKGACLIPKWYGVAYNRFDRNEVVMALIPINLLLRLARDIYIICKQGGRWNRKHRMTLEEKIIVLERDNKQLQGELQMARIVERRLK